jgi:hypothetical protein
MAQDSMDWDRGSMDARALDQFTPAEKFERSLDGALREARFFGERTQAGRDRFPLCARGLTVEPEINEIRGRLAIVPDDVAHQDVENVVVDRNNFAETRHAESKKEELRIKK